jgi:hypothetical protein
MMPCAKFDFNEKYTEWQHTLQRWKATQRTWKAHCKGIGTVDLADRGAIKPPFGNFWYEDWALLNLRVELHLLTFAVRSDTDGRCQLDFPLGHLSYYYNKYFMKPLVLSNYGFKKEGELIGIVEDTVAIKGELHHLEPQLDDDTDFSEFVFLTEGHRLDRSRRVDAGDESAILHFAKF